MKKNLFISHDASQSGAPIYLLNFIKWLKSNYEINCIILLQTGGELQSEFEALGETFVWDAHHTSSNITEKFISKVGYKEISISYTERIIKEIKMMQPDMVVSNTIVSNKLAFLLKQNLTCPFIAIYHEMKFSASFYYADYMEKKYISIFDKIITINESIKDFIINDYFFNKKNIFVIPPFIAVPKNNNNVEINKGEKFNVLLSGFGAWQKGFDLLGTLFSNIKYKNIDNKFSFTWLGDIASDQMKMLSFELYQFDANDIIVFPGKVKNVEDYFTRASLFLLLSKEDSFPITCIEAASYGIPILAFDKSGGIVEFIKNGAGECVPFMDMNELVNKISLFESDKIYYEQKSKNAIKLSNDYTINIVAPQIVKVFIDSGINLQKKIE